MFSGDTESIPSESATGSAINIFFYNVEVVNNVTKIVLEWTLGSEKKTQVKKQKKKRSGTVKTKHTEQYTFFT